MTTDLTRILSISGQHGLFRYLAQARNGVIVEALSDGKRTVADAKSRISTLADIAVYTSEGEVKLKDVLLKLKEVLGDSDAPSSKSSPAELKDLFGKALPTYDDTRFYVSHMKKIVDWYNELKSHASLEFASDEEQASEEVESAPSEDSAND